MQTLPKGMVIKRSHIRNAGLGVFATESFTDGATFGPYEGEKLKANIPRVGLDTSYMWEVSVFNFSVSVCLCEGKNYHVFWHSYFQRMSAEKRYNTLVDHDSIGFS